MKTLFTMLIGCFIAFNNSAQTTHETPAVPHIEVNGTAEMEVVPNEIYIQFYLKEYEKDRVLQTIQQQEEALTSALMQAGLKMAEINVSDFESNYVRVEWGKKDYRQEKKYDFKVHNLQETAQVFEVFEKLEIRHASITRVDHSERKQYENQMRIEATKNAKFRANEMLSAIGQKAGKALFVQETYLTPIEMRQIDRLSGVTYGELSTLKGGAVVQYQKIKISASVFARFVIE
jgi:uncharacterized protein